VSLFHISDAKYIALTFLAIQCTKAHIALGPQTHLSTSQHCCKGAYPAQQAVFGRGGGGEPAGLEAVSFRVLYGLCVGRHANVFFVHVQWLRIVAPVKIWLNQFANSAWALGPLWMHCRPHRRGVTVETVGARRGQSDLGIFIYLFPDAVVGT
jgi:hypothetical protein